MTAQQKSDRPHPDSGGKTVVTVAGVDLTEAQQDALLAWAADAYGEDIIVEMHDDGTLLILVPNR